MTGVLIHHKKTRILREDFYPLRSLSLTIIHCHAASEICVSYHLSSGAGQHIQLPTHTKTRKIHNNVHWSVTHSSNAYLQWQVSSQRQVDYPSGVVVEVFSDCYTLKCRKASKSSEQSVGTKNIHETPYIEACQQETSLCLINKVRQIMNKGQLLLITTFNKNHAYLVCLWIMISNFNRLWKTWGKLLTGNSTQLPCSISSQATILVALPCRHVCDWNLFSHNRTGL